MRQKASTSQLPRDTFVSFLTIKQRSNIPVRVKVVLCLIIDQDMCEAFIEVPLLTKLILDLTYILEQVRDFVYDENVTELVLENSKIEPTTYRGIIFLS